VSAPEIDARIVAHLVALCEADPTREACGFVVRRAGALHVEPVPNVADRYHERDPVQFPRTSRDSYLMDPKVQLRIHRELEAQGGEIAVVWHSHVETGAYFSAKDRADAVVEGQPTVPGAEYLVLGVQGGKVFEIRRFRWNGKEHAEAPLALGPVT
jgi:proteasome lid subunit RPN8/RPN11